MESAATAPIRILVIDDEEAARFGMRKALERESYQVDLASDGGEALTKILEDSPQVVISDINMPNMDGITLLKELGRLDAPPSVILVTAHGSETLAVQGLRAGAYDYLSKPFEVDDLRKTVRNAVEKQRLLEANRCYCQNLEQALQELKQSQGERIQAEKMAALGRLVAGIAHEVNSPLGALASAIDTFGRAYARMRELLQQEGLPAQTMLKAGTFSATLEDTLRVAQEACQRMDSLVKTMRRFANLDQAPLRMARIQDCIESALALLNHKLTGRIGVARDFEESPEIECYPMELNQVFTCLLLNSIEAMDGAGGIHVRIWMSKDELCVKLTDTGRGIAGRDLDKIFDPGFTTKGVGVGTGMGLPTCKRIIEKHRGRISVASELGAGTSVTLCLPLRQG